MSNDAMRNNWSAGGERWAANERIFDAVFSEVTAAIVSAADLAVASRVLDVGCGTGTLLAAARDVGTSVVGVDISPTMAAAAERRVPEATVVVADAQSTDLLAAAPGDPFDRVVSRFGVMFFADPEAAFANIRVSAEPGAKLVFASWRPDEYDIFSVGIGPLAARIDEPLVRPPLDQPGPLGLADPHRIEAILEASGWGRVAIDPVDVVCDFSIDGSDGVEERLAMALSGSFGRMIQAKLEPVLTNAEWEAVLDESRAEIRARVVDGSVRLTGHVWLVTAENP